MRRRTRNNKLRRGSVAVEFAITAPILFTLVLGALELSHAHMVLNTLESAAYEGARKGIVPAARADECQAAANQILDACNVAARQINVSPSNLETNSETVIVEIEAHYEDNAIVSPFFTRGMVFRRSCELQRE